MLQTPPFNEELLFTGDKDCFGYYQIDRNGEGAKCLYQNYSYLSRQNIAIKGSYYILAYGGELDTEETMDLLEQIYKMFTISFPEDYKGHALAVSDVIVIRRNKITTAYYVDDIEFPILKDFVKERCFLHEAKKL